MSYTVSELLLRNLRDVFGENDPARRRAAINELYNEECVFYDPNAASPNSSGAPIRCRWVSGTPGKAPAYAGTDFVIARNGRIAAVYLFFDGPGDVSRPNDPSK